MGHVLSKTYIISAVTEMISKKSHISLNEARDHLYSSVLIDLINDDEMGLYGDSPLYVFSIYEELTKKDE